MLRFLILSLVAGMAVSESQETLTQKASSILDQIEDIPNQMALLRTVDPLHEAIDEPNTIQLTLLDSEVRKEAAKHVRNTVETLLKKLEDEQQYEVNVLKNLLKGTPSQEKAQDFIDLMERWNKGEKLLEGATNNIFRKEYIISSAQLTEYGFFDWISSIGDFFNGIGNWISDKYSSFKDWAQGVFGKVIDASKPLIDQVKDLAIQFLKENWATMSKELVKQAIEFFTEYDGEIGAEIMDRLIALARHFGIIPWEKYKLLN